MEEQNTMNKILLEGVVTNIRNTITEYIHENNPTDIGKIDNAYMMVVGQQGTYNLHGIKIGEGIPSRYYFDVTDMMKTYPEMASTYIEPAPYVTCVDGPIPQMEGIFVAKSKRAKELLEVMNTSVVSYHDMQIGTFGVDIDGERYVFYK